MHMHAHTCSRRHTQAHLAKWPALRDLQHPLPHTAEPGRRSPSLGAARRQRKTRNFPIPSRPRDTAVPGVWLAQGPGLETEPQRGESQAQARSGMGGAGFLGLPSSWGHGSPGPWAHQTESPCRGARVAEGLVAPRSLLRVAFAVTRRRDPGGRSGFRACRAAHASRRPPPKRPSSRLGAGPARAGPSGHLG